MIAFHQNLIPYRSILVILAFCEPSNPFRIWNESKEKFFSDFRRRNSRSLINGNDLQSDSVAETYVLNEIQNLLREMTSNLDLKQLSLLKVPSYFAFVAFDENLKHKTTINGRASIPTSRNLTKF